MGPLIAVCAGADSAIDPDIGDIGISLLELLSIANRIQVLDPASHCNCEALTRRSPISVSISCYYPELFAAKPHHNPETGL